MSLASLIEENKPLAPFTTLGIGGPARWFVEATREDEVAEAAAWARNRGLELFVLGGGSNLVVSDCGFNGLVLRVGLSGITFDRTEENLASCGRRGLGWIRAARREGMRRDRMSGGNSRYGGRDAGAERRRVWAGSGFGDRSGPGVRSTDQAWVEFTAAECGFAYRRSRFNTVDRGRYVVTRVNYRLTPGGAATLNYADVQRALGTSAQPSLVEVARSGAADSAKQRNAAGGGGSRLPQRGELLQESIVKKEQADRIEQRSGKELPRFPAGVGPGMNRWSRFPQRGSSSRRDLPGDMCWEARVFHRGTRWR